MRATLARLIVQLAARLVPAHVRAQWKQEWLAELASTDSARTDRHLRRAAGAPKDAVLLRLDGLSSGLRGWPTDVRHAWRSWRQAPLQTLVVFICLTVGSTLTVLMFAVVNALTAGDLVGVQDRGRLARLRAETAYGDTSLDAADFRAFPTDVPGLRSIGAEVESRGLAVSVDGTAMIARGRYVSGSYFATLGTIPAAGRLIERRDDVATAPAIAVVSERFARQQFSSPSAAVGSTLRTGSVMAIIIGVVPPGFGGIRPGNLGESADRNDVWLPMSLVQRSDQSASGFSGNLSVVARLAPGVSAAIAERDLQSLAARFNAERPRRWPLTAIRLMPLQLFEDNWTATDVAAGTAGIMAVPLVVLAIACANVAGVSLARALSRTHELAVRVSLGASRVRVARMLALETGSIALAAGLLAWGITTQALRLSSELLPVTVTPDLRVLIFSIALPCVVTLVAGLLPAWRATGFDVLAGLRLGARAGLPTGRRWRRWVTAGQIALSVTLLSGATFLIRAFTETRALGLDQHDVLVVDVRFLNLGLGEERERLARVTVLDAARALPGVAGAAIGERLLSATNGSLARSVTPDWFDVVGLDLVAGRQFAGEEPGVAVINETWARQLGGTPLALGATIRLTDRRAVTVIGVVQNAYERIRWNHDVPVAYVPSARTQAGDFTLYLRGPLAADSAAAVRKILHGVDPAFSPYAIATLSEAVAAHSRAELGVARAIGVASLLAVGIAAIGLFGSTSQAVARRTHEFGVRIALGARPHEIGARVIRETLSTTLAGGLSGFGLAALIVAGMSPSGDDRLNLLDPIPMVITLGVIAAVGLAAAFEPARRVMTIDPLKSLRTD